MYYRVKLSNGYCSDVYSNVEKLTSVYGAKADLVDGDKTVCSGSDATLILTGHTGTVQWQGSFNGVDWVDISNGTNSTLYLSSVDNDRFFRTVVTYNTCKDTSNTVRITITPKATGGFIVEGDDSICSGSSKNYSVVGASGNIQWQSSIDNIGFLDIINDTNPAINTNPSITTYYRVKAVNGMCIDYSDVVKLRVDSMPVGGTVYPNQTHCIGTTSSVFATGYLGKINWQISDEGTIFRDTAINLNSLSVSPNHDTYYRIIASSGVCNTVTSNIIKLSAVPGPVKGIVTVSSDTICKGSPVSISIFGNSGDIQWQQRLENSTAWNDIPGENSNILDVTPYETDNYRAKINLNTCPPIFSDQAKVTAIEVVIPGSITASQPVLCKGGEVKLSLNGSYGNVQWEELLEGGGWRVIEEATSNTYQAFISRSTSYRALVNNNFCSDSTMTFKVEVNKDTIGILKASVKEICPGEEVVINLENASGDILWESSLNGIDFKKIKEATTSSLVVYPFVTTYYRSKVSNSLCPSLYSVIDTVNVIEYPEAGTIYSSQIIRPGALAVLEVKHFVGNVQWQSSEDTISFKDIPGAVSNKITVSPATNRYYRVKAISGNCFDYGNPAEIIVDHYLYNISPVPSVDYLRIKYNLVDNRLLSLRIYSMLGKLLYEGSFNGVSGYNEINLDISKFEAGSYYLIIDDKVQLMHTKFIKQNQ